MVPPPPYGAPPPVPGPAHTGHGAADQFKDAAEKASAVAGAAASAVADKTKQMAEKLQSNEAVAKLTKKVKPLYLAIGAAAALLIVLFGAMLLFGGGSKFDMVKGGFAITTDGEDIFIFDGKNNIKLIGTLSSWQPSMDGRKMALLTGDNTLYHIANGKSTKISEEVHNFRLSDNGNAVAYIKDFEYSPFAAGTLMLWDNGSQRTVTQNAAGGGSYVISPDGKTIAYSAIPSSSDDGTYIGYISIKGGSAESLGRLVRPVAVADGGAYVYFINVDRDGALFVKAGKKDAERLTATPDYLIWNKDYSEILFNDDNGARISAKGRESSGNLTRNTTIYGVLAPEEAQMRSLPGAGAVYGIKTFRDTVVGGGSEIIYINSKTEGSRITAAASDAFISKDGNTVVILNERGNVIKYTNLKKDPPAEKEIASKVDDLIVSSDGKKIYYIDEEENLWFVSGNSSPKRIRQMVYGWLTLNKSGDTVFFLAEWSNSSGSGKLFSSKNGASAKAVSSSEDITRVYSFGGGIIYRHNTANGVADFFHSKSGSKFTRIFKDVSNTLRYY
jgi:hypothetical protein